MTENLLTQQKSEKEVISNAYRTNMRGRPTLEKTILFSPQPKSIVAQLLTKKKTVPSDTAIISLVLNESSKKSLPAGKEGTRGKTKVYTCEDCSYRNENIQAYRKHITSHKQFNCNFHGCNYTCKLLSNLIKHKRLHTDERPYLCDRCSFRTNYVNSLKAHRRTHTLERPYQCKHCDYKCNSSSNLKKHCIQKHSEILMKCN